MKKFLIMAMSLALVATGLQGCNETQEAAAVGAVIGAVIGAAVADDNTHVHVGVGPRCHGGYVTQCSDYRDFYGRWYRECRQVWDSCARYYNIRNDEPGMSSETAAVVKTFNLSIDAAEKILESVDSLKKGDVAAAKQIGLSAKDLRALSEHRSLSASSIENVAKTLNVSIDTAENMLAKLAAKYAQLYPENAFPGGAQLGN